MAALPGAHRDRGTQVRTGVEIAGLRGRYGSVVAVELTDGSQIVCSTLLLGVGAAPRDELAVSAGLDCDQGIIVDDAARTSDPAILAIGDVTWPMPVPTFATAHAQLGDTMPAITYILPDTTERRFEVPTGQSVMDGSISNNLPGIIAECGGSCSCATCHVYLDRDWTSAFTEPTDEEAALGEFTDGARAESRLACQLVVTEAAEGARVKVADIRV